MVESGHFYFLKDAYYARFQDKNLMTGKGKGHERPCFCVIEDSATGVFWLIPISSQIQKYRKIHNEKIARHGSCDTIKFGKVLGHEKAFLIQNMCPTTDAYIDFEYIHNNKAVAIDGALAKELSETTKKVLALVRKGVANLVFVDILEIEKNL